MEEKSNLKIIKEGIFDKNPIFILVLGMCPTLAVTTSFDNAFYMAIATSFVLFFSNLIVSSLKGIISRKTRIPVFIVIIATFVTIASLFLEAYYPIMFRKLGIYVPLIVVNCIILGRAEAFAFRNKVSKSIMDGIGIGIGFTVGILLVGVIREIIGTSKLVIFGREVINFGFASVNMFILPAGALLTIGLLLAIFNVIKEHRKQKTEEAP